MVSVLKHVPGIIPVVRAVRTAAVHVQGAAHRSYLVSVTPDTIPKAMVPHARACGIAARPRHAATILQVIRAHITNAHRIKKLNAINRVRSRAVVMQRAHQTQHVHMTQPRHIPAHSIMAAVAMPPPVRVRWNQ